MFHFSLRKSFTLRGQDSLNVGRDFGGINLLNVIHINLVVVAVLLNEWRYSLFSTLLLTTTVRRSHCSLGCALSNLEFAAFVRFCFVPPR